MRRAQLSHIIAAGFLALSPISALAEEFNFEDLSVGTIVRAQYGPRGVIFFGAYLDQDSHATSGTRVLRAVSPSAEVFTAVPLLMSFTSPQTHVAFHAGNEPGETRNGTLKAFGASGAVVAQDGPKPVPVGSFAASFDVRVPTATIVRAEFQVEESAREAIDDLVVEGTSTPPPKNPPVVTITNPTEGATLPKGSFVIRGTVTGESVLDPITIRININAPEDSSAPPSENEVRLSGSGTSRTFSFDYSILTGPMTITALATNTANLHGTATVHVSSLPDTIRARYQSAGGAATFGNLRFGADGDGCVMAVCDKGAIAAMANQTFTVLGAIFQKWIATREAARSTSNLGCPTAEQRDALAGARAQDFEHGRIYITANSAAYVPGVFRDAIESLGGEATTGIATSDPTASIGAMQTWLFQRFARLDHASVEPSTLEIRGLPPVLYVERVGDGLDDLEGGDLSLSPTTATVFRAFKCAGELGPCTVRKPGWSPTISDGSRYCDGRYPVTSLTEWSAMQTNYTQTPAGGWVKQSRTACWDNPLTHDYQLSGPDPSCEPPKVVFPSDWQVYVQPMNPYGEILTFDQSTIEIEFEAFYARAMFARLGWPVRGDLIYVNGRWIMDCGHSPYKTEIHPPFLMSYMRTQRTGGTLETVAQIWVTGYYPGDPIDLDLWPPPRPTPDAFLTVIRPTDDAGVGLSVTVSTSFSGARARFTAPHREVEVDGSGKMHWATLRGYEGEWQLHWSLR
jgi:hypothetical protein